MSVCATIPYLLLNKKSFWRESLVFPGDQSWSLEAKKLHTLYSFYIILNGLKSNSRTNWTSSNELHERSECNSIDRVQFFPNCSKPFNMYIIKWEPYLAKFGDILMRVNNSAPSQFGLKLFTHLIMAKIDAIASRWVRFLRKKCRVRLNIITRTSSLELVPTNKGYA